MTEFVTPSFLENHSTDDIHEKMQAILPADLDLSEGGHAWNMTRPTALVLAELCEFILPEVIKLVFPDWSYGDFLDGHATARGLARRSATASTGTLAISGEPYTVIPAGSLFSSAAVNDDPSVDYETLAEVTIPESGTVTVDVQCTQTGIVGNAQAGTVVLVSSKLTGITAVTNEDDITGGTEEEADGSLIERINEYDKSQGDSFIGCVADYKRWATSVDGVGSATVIPATDDSGLVTIVLTDSNGDPANEALCTAVYNYIMRPDDPAERPAPVNALLSVIAPDTLAIGITATVELPGDATIESVTAAFLPQLSAYLPTALDEGTVKYTRVAAILTAVDGVGDFSGLQIGTVGGSYGTDNITIAANQLPTVDEGDLVLEVGT